MDGQALQWHRWMYNKGQLNSWSNFFHSLQTRFGPSQFEDSQGSLFKLTQTISVRGYQCQFEPLSNRVVGLPHNFLLSCFISSLKPHIRCEVQALQPLSLMHAIDLAKLREDKYSEIRKFQRLTNLTVLIRILSPLPNQPFRNGCIIY